MNPLYIDLFCGAGGTSTGVELARIDDDTPKELIEYDTTQCNGNLYPLPRGKGLQLIFIGNHRIPFCTIRRHTNEKTDYYK